MGIPPFPSKFFFAIWRNLISAGAGFLSLVWKGSVPIGGMISLVSQDTLIAAYAAPQKQWRMYYPSERALWHAMEWACEHKLSRLDFGADSPRQKGLLQFKKKWGGIPSRTYNYYFLNGSKKLPNFDGDSQTYERLRQAWARLPHAIARPLGSWDTKQLS